MNAASANTAWDIRAEGRRWEAGEALQRYLMIERKIEMIEGQLFGSVVDRETLLCLLLENVGADRAVQFGSAEVWRNAVAKLERKS